MTYAASLHKYRRSEGPPPVVAGAPVALKIEASVGRLNVSGPSCGMLRAVAGATWNPKKKWMELSLTLDSFRRICSVCAIDKTLLWSFCSASVKAWAKAAGESEKLLRGLHQRLNDGYRREFSWVDNQTGTPVGTARYRPEQVEYNAVGVLVWKYRLPFEHQSVMATVAAELDGCGFLCEMGTGKTRAAAETIGYKFESGEIDLMVVVCPKGVMNTWVRELATWLRPGSVTPFALEGRVTRRITRIQELGDAVREGSVHHPVIIVNLNVLSELVQAFVEVADSGVKLGYLVDEMHRMANPETAVTRAGMKLAQHAEWRLGLTGTPIRNTHQDVWSQWYLIDLGITFGANFVQFRREFSNENPYNWSVDPVDGALDEIGTRLRMRGLRYRKEDCLDLPPKLYETIEVDMAPDQARAYAEMERELVARLRGEDGEEDLATAATQLVAILRLCQITSGFVPNEHGELHRFMRNPKMDALEEIVRDTIREQQQIIWAVYRADHDFIAHRLADLLPAVIRGGVSNTDREVIEQQFMQGSRRLIIGQQSAAGVGINLQAASMAHYFSQGYSYIDRAQSEDRNHRSGSEQHWDKGHVLFNDILCRGTVDYVVRDAVLAKKELSEIVVDLRHALGV